MNVFLFKQCLTASIRSYVWVSVCPCVRPCVRMSEPENEHENALHGYSVILRPFWTKLGGVVYNKFWNILMLKFHHLPSWWRYNSRLKRLHVLAYNSWTVARNFKIPFSLDSLAHHAFFHIGHAHFRLGSFAAILHFSSKHTFCFSSYIFSPNVTKIGTGNLYTPTINILKRHFDSPYRLSVIRFRS